MDRDTLLEELKQLVIDECDQPLDPATLAAQTTLIGSGSDLGLDSLDALQIALAVKQRYGKRIDGGNATRAALRSFATLADFILD